MGAVVSCLCCFSGVEHITHFPYSSVDPFHGINPSGIGCSTCVPHGVRNPARILLQGGFPMGSQPPSGLPLLQCGVSRSCRWISAPSWAPMGCRGTVSSPWAAPWAGNLSFGAWSSSCSSLCTGLGAGLFLHILTPLSRCCFTFPPLFSVIPEVLPLSLMGSALSSGTSILKQIGILLQGPENL